MPSYQKTRIQLDPAERLRRKRFLAATSITCVALAMVFGAVHVVQLGSNRMADMRARASYDLKDEVNRIRAAGEEIMLHRMHAETNKALKTYLLEEVTALITPEQWQELDVTVLIPKGPFLMGTNASRADLQNKPQHTRQLDAYFIDKYPVTNVQYARYVAQTKYRSPLDWTDGKVPDKKLLHPVTMVSWYDAKTYCEYYAKRLPSEAEWEKAARGPNGKRWPWGSTMIPERLNTYYHIGATTNVTRYDNGQSEFGVYDMAGNVSEWTSTRFAPYEGSKAAASLFAPKALIANTAADKAMSIGDLVEVEDRVFRVRRGGSWKSDPFSTSSYHRNFSMPHYASDFFGFRCAKDAE
ncbi:MAG: formylglycine-generating enzyme family protein [Gammaproteobacteria bacterium]|nr:formylglycine-generating enzyme family protein [Gammaproteobacteria bacterium]